MTSSVYFKKILIVDDDKSLNDSLRRKFQRLDLKRKAATTASRV